MQEYSVSEISSKIKRLIEGEFSTIRIKGEVSSLKIATSGHVYFDLKDNKALINAVMWKGLASKLNFKLENGLEIIVTGKISAFSGRSNYQIIADNIEPSGEGALMAMLERRKKALAAEGLFDASHKKIKPFSPKIIGIITSPTGAVIRDIIHRIKDRFPAHIIIAPVKVQGAGAAEQIASAINYFQNSQPRPELLIVARGGGSMEDLMPFNEEIVVRATANSTIPLISAIGHETDTTLIDYASDIRAPTPSAAAEMAVPVRTELINWVKEADSRLFNSINRKISHSKERLEGLERGLPKPNQIINNAQQILDDRVERLIRTVPELIVKQQVKLDNISSMLNILDWKNTLKRGFSIVKNDNDELISSTVGAQKNMQIIFADGSVVVKEYVVKEY